MNPVLLEDTRKIMDETEAIKQCLKRLEKDYLKWTATYSERELSGLLENAKGVEDDVSLLVADFISAGYQSTGGTEIIFNDFHHFFAFLDDLFHDLKKARSSF